MSATDRTEVSIAFKMAELRYLTASAALSEQLAKQYVNFDHLAIGLGLGFLFLVINACNFHTLNRIFILLIAVSLLGIMRHHIYNE